MRVLVTDATGLIEGAIARRLKAAGHEVVGLARSESSSGKLAGEGFKVMRADPASVASTVHGTDAVVHAASLSCQNTAAHDGMTTHAIIEALGGTGKRFLYTSGCLINGATGDDPATQDRPLNPIDLVRWRQKLEGRVLEAAAHSVQLIVIRPDWVYGNWGVALP